MDRHNKTSCDHDGRGNDIVNAIRSGQASSSIVLGPRGFSAFK